MRHIAFILLLVGCGQADESLVEAAASECHAAGLSAAIHYGSQTDVECVPVFSKRAATPE